MDAPGDPAVPARPRSARLTRRGWLGLTVALWLLAYVHSVTAGVGITDESWFLRVVDRVAAGDVLYRDVFFGSTPLAVWLAVGPVALLGSEMLVLKGVAALVVAGAGIAVAGCARSLGFGPRGAAAIAAFCVLVPGLRHSSVYNWLTVALTLATLAALLRWDPASPSRRALAAAGAFAGLAFATKHNVGALAVLALAAGIGVRGGRAALRHAIPPAAGAAFSTAVLALLPVLVAGGGPRLLEYAVTAKGTYVERGEVSFLDGVRSGAAAWLDIDGVRSLEDALLRAGFLVLPLAAAAIALAIARAGDPAYRGRLVTLVLFGAAIVANLYPRADAPHLAVTLPVIFLAVAVAARDLLGERPVRRAAAGAAGAVAGLLAVATFAQLPVWLAYGRVVLADVPHFRAMPVAPEARDRMRHERRQLMLAARREAPILTLGSHAAYVQLLGDLESATPYDYPLVTAFGHDGEQRTARAVREGRIRAACVTNSEDGLEAVRLEAAVRDVLRARGRVGICLLFTR
jgi:hypothetical protein